MGGGFVFVFNGKRKGEKFNYWNFSFFKKKKNIFKKGGGQVFFLLSGFRFFFFWEKAIFLRLFPSFLGKTGEKKKKIPLPPRGGPVVFRFHFCPSFFLGLEKNKSVFAGKNLFGLRGRGKKKKIC